MTKQPLQENKTASDTPSGWDDLRPEVQAFALAMESKLRLNDHKGGWSECDPWDLLLRSQEELFELEEALCACEEVPMLFPQRERHTAFITTLHDAMLESADVANFSLMIWDILQKRLQVWVSLEQKQDQEQKEIELPGTEPGAAQRN